MLLTSRNDSLTIAHEACPRKPKSLSLPCLVPVPLFVCLALVLLLSLPLECSQALWQARATTALDASGLMRSQPQQKARAMTW